MAFEFIKETELVTEFESAKKFMAPLHQPYTELERIVANKPHPGIAKHLPKVTDGTTASHIKERPKRIIQQIPTGAVTKCDDWLKLVAGFILENEILPNSNQMGALIQKYWSLVSKADTYGSQPAFVQFVNRGEYFGTDWALPYIKDVLLEPGKLSDRDSNIIYLRSWWSKNQVEAICYKEKELAKRAKERGEKYESGWDLAELSKLKDEVNQKDDEAKTPQERAKGQTTQGFIEIVHCFQRGIGATFYSFSPQTKAVVRKKVNRDPRGVIPIHFMYSDLDFSNPLGRSLVELAAPLQNLIDSEMQMYQFNRALMLNPPLKVWGDIKPKYAPDALWKMGSNKAQGTDVEPAIIDTQAIANFATNYGLMKGQLMELLTGGGGANSISADSGNPNYSKTQAGVKAQEARLGTNDNHVRKNLESTAEEIMETQLNLYFAERSGIQELELDKETAGKVRKLNPSAVNEQNVIQIDYDTETPQLKFEIDASSSMKNEQAEQLEPLGLLLEKLETSPLLQQIVPQESIKETWNAIVSASGVENAEKLQIPMEDEEGNPIQEQQEPQMTPEMIQEIVMPMIEQAVQEKDANSPEKHPMVVMMKTLGIKFTDLPDDAQRKVIADLQLPVEGELPSEHDKFLKESELELKATQAGHSMEQAEASQVLSASDAALRIQQANQPDARPSKQPA